MAPASDRVTRGKLGETGREYFLRRANELFHWVYPLRGSLTRKVWDDLGAYRGLHEAALTALAERDDSAYTRHVAQRAWPIQRQLPGHGRCELTAQPIGELRIRCDHTSRLSAIS